MAAFGAKPRSPHDGMRIDAAFAARQRYGIISGTSRQSLGFCIVYMRGLCPGGSLTCSLGGAELCGGGLLCSERRCTRPMQRTASAGTTSSGSLVCCSIASLREPMPHSPGTAFFTIIALPFTSRRPAKPAASLPHLLAVQLLRIRAEYKTHDLKTIPAAHAVEDPGQTPTSCAAGHLLTA